MPMTVEEYQIGQMYMTARTSYEESNDKDRLEQITTTPCTHPEYGTGRYTEKKIYVSERMPSWLRPLVPNILHVVEKSWDYYPYMETVYECSLVPQFSMKITSMHQSDNGSQENCLCLEEEELKQREVDYIDILTDPVDEDQYKEEEDLSLFKSEKTDRGPLQEGWREKTETIMCCYKLVDVSFGVFGLQTAVENCAHQMLRNVMLVGYRREFAWIDEWIDMTLEDVKQYESVMEELSHSKMQEQRQREEECTEHTTPCIEESKEKNENEEELKEEGNSDENKVELKKSESVTSSSSSELEEASLSPPQETCSNSSGLNWQSIKGMS